MFAREVAVIGAGPAGAFAALMMARRGHRVTVIDRDTGPTLDGHWRRRAVMQFEQPHGFRPQVREVLSAELPDVWSALLADGCWTWTMPGAGSDRSWLAARRSTIERTTWTALAKEPRVTLLTAKAQDVRVDADRASGVVIDGDVVDADVVLAATGHLNRIADQRRAPGRAEPCGLSYVSRMYRARPGVEVPEQAIPAPADGYVAMTFPQDDHTLSVLIVHPSADRTLARLREPDVFDAVTKRVPALAPWVDPDRFIPISTVHPGAGLVNSYRGQLDEHERVPVVGLCHLGDATLITNPMGARGFSTALLQAQQLASYLSVEPTDLRDVSQRLDAWSKANLKPWFDDHCVCDADLLQRMCGEDVDPDGPISSNLVVAASERFPEIWPAASAYLDMTATPDILDPYRERVRGALKDGWRPKKGDGPSRDQLASTILGL